MIISVLPNLSNQGVEKLARDVFNTLNRFDTKVYVSDEYKDIFSDCNVYYTDALNLIHICDVAIAIGGDGTTLNVAKKAAQLDKHILGINAGRLGFMSGLEKDELSLLERVVYKDYEIDERLMLKADVVKNGKIILTRHCLNDFVISRGFFARLIDINITCDNRNVMNMRADGIILSTPTGSTAYSMAAGGPVVSPEASCMIATPICSHSLMDRSFIFSTDQKLVIKADNDLNNPPVMTVDGQEAIDIEQDCEIHVSKSDMVTKLIKIKPENFY